MSFFVRFLANGGLKDRIPLSLIAIEAAREKVLTASMGIGDWVILFYANQHMTMTWAIMTRMNIQSGYTVA